MVLALISEASFVFSPVILKIDLLSNSRTAPDPLYAVSTVSLNVSVPSIFVVSTINLPLDITLAFSPLSCGLPILIPAELTPLPETSMFVVPSSVAFASLPDIYIPTL